MSANSRTAPTCARSRWAVAVMAALAATGFGSGALTAQVAAPFEPGSDRAMATAGAPTSTSDAATARDAWVDTCREHPGPACALRPSLDASIATLWTPPETRAETRDPKPGTTPVLLPQARNRRGLPWIIAGSALIVGGAIVGDDAGDVLMVGGVLATAYGLYIYF